MFFIEYFKSSYKRKKIQKLYKKGINEQLWSKKFHLEVKKNLGIEVGFGSYGYLFFPEGTKIGNYCSIAQGVKYLSGNHPIENASSAACFYNPLLGFVDKKYDIKRSKLTIDNDVWIGENVLITNKCTHIPNGVVIGAGSVLTRNPEPYGIYAGNPARLLHYRFDNDTISSLENSKWWEYKPNIIIKYIDCINKPMDFSKKILGENNE